MSDSPRKLLRRALRALEEAESVSEQYPEAREQMERALGSPALAELDAMRSRLQAIVARLDAPAASAAATPDEAPPDVPAPKKAGTRPRSSP